MSTLSAKLKQRARVLAVGAALSAATLAILPGVAEAQEALGTRALAGMQGANAGPKATAQIGGAAQGVGADSGLRAQARGSGNITATLSQNTNSIGLTTASQRAIGAVQGVSTGPANRAGGAATVNSTTVATERVAERPVVNGAVGSTTEAVAPAVPAQTTATVNENVAVGDVVNQDVCLDAALNQQAGSCGSSGDDTGTTLGTNAGSIELAAPKGAVDSATTVAENASAAERPLLDGSVNNKTEVAAPSVPAEGVTTVDANATAGDLVNQDVCLNAGINAPAGECQSAAPAADTPATNGDGSGAAPQDDPATASPAVDGSVNSRTGVDAPAVPVEGAATVDGDTVIDELAAVGICLGVGLNQDPGTCERGASPGDQSGDGGTLVDGDIDTTAGVDAPGVPAEGGAALDAGAVADGLASLYACVNAGVNQEPASCDERAAANDSGDGTTPDGGGNTPDDVGNAPNGGGSGAPSGDETPGGGGETPDDFEDDTSSSVTNVPESVDAPGSPDFAASPSAERSSSAPELRFADSSTVGDALLFSTTSEDADLRLLLSEPGSSLASGTTSDGPVVGIVFTSGEHLTDAEGRQQLGVGHLPDTGGVELWKATLGLLLLLTGLLAARKSWAEEVARN